MTVFAAVDAKAAAGASAIVDRWQVATDTIWAGSTSM